MWQGVGMTPVQAPRARARDELMTALKEAARARLASDGAAGLSLRAVARDLGVVSSAVYRYVESRDALLTLLILDAYDAMGDVAERADAAAAARRGATPGGRWLAVCRAVREWAVHHPQEFALVYGSPVPGYAAPPATIAPASRIFTVMAGVVRDAHAAGALSPPATPLPGPRLVTSDVKAVAAMELPRGSDLIERSLLLAITLVGALSFELFGHLHNVVTDPAAYFDVTVVVAAEAVGLAVPLRGRRS